MKSAVIVFPGSNCDRDVAEAIRLVTGRAPAMVWHRETSFDPVDLVVIPGGFSYGDYLRSGAMAAHSPVMAAVKAHARRGRLLLGICNGFQVLTETGLLPGGLMRNENLLFVSRIVKLKVERTDSPFTAGYRAGQILQIPVAHHDGRFTADANTLRTLEDKGQVAFRYAEPVNGSQGGIAGVFSPDRRILGLMPHPERVVEPLHGLLDGRSMFESLARAA